MSVKIFVDTNIFVYAAIQSPGSEVKRATAIAVLTEPETGVRLDILTFDETNIKMSSLTPLVHIKERSGKYPPYNSHEEAQQACWSYWSSKQASPNDEQGVEEGISQDRSIRFRSRNKVIIEKRKSFDNYTCKACGYKKNFSGQYIIDCHHIFPIGSCDDSRITNITDLVCLCPNCHRIAHTNKFPLSYQEIKKHFQLT